jgi:hypothetical protein
MAFDFNPDLTSDDMANMKEAAIAEEKRIAAKAEAALVANSGNAEVVTMNNLLNITQSHVADDTKCRQVVETLTNELNNSIHLMSIKEILEYLKIKLREREFHVDCIFKAYSFIQKSEYSREMFIGSNRKERIIEATDRKRITGLLDMLNDTDNT